MKTLPAALFVFVCALLASETTRADTFRINCYVQEDGLYMRCPTADRGWLKHHAAMYAGMFREKVFPPNLKPGDPLSCGIDAKTDLTDCVPKK